MSRLGLNGPWLGRIALALPTVFAIVVLYFGIPAASDAFSNRNIGNKFAADFSYLRDGGRTITSDHPEALYRRDEFQSAQWFHDHNFDIPGGYGYAPAFAFLISPLNDIREARAFDIWQAIIAASIVVVAIGVASAFQSWPWRVAAIAAVVCSEIMLLNLKIGQTGAFVAAITCVGFLLFLHKREWGAAVLGLLILKPPALIGPALAVFPEKTRVWAWFAIPMLVLGLLPFFFIGFGSLGDWVTLLIDRSKIEVGYSTKYDQGLSGIGVGSGVSLIVMAVVLPALAFGISKVTETDGVEIASAMALLVGQLINPHSLLYEWGAAFVAIMLLRRSQNLGAFSTDLGAGLLLISLFLAGQLAWDQRQEDLAIQPLTVWGGAVVIGLAVAIVLRWRSRPAAAAPALESATEP